jgi:hypothetical protein
VGGGNGPPPQGVATKSLPTSPPTPSTLQIQAKGVKGEGPWAGC